MDVELAVDAMRLADNADHIILFSGEQSFASLVSALQQKGKRVTVISTIETQPAMVADELRRQADHFIDIDTLQSQIARVGRTPRPAGFDREDRFRRSQGDDDRSHAGEDAEQERPEPQAVHAALALETVAAPGTEAGSSSDEPRSEAIAGETEGSGATPVVRTVRRRRTQA